MFLFFFYSLLSEPGSLTLFTLTNNLWHHMRYSSRNTKYITVHYCSSLKRKQIVCRWKKPFPETYSYEHKRTCIGQQRPQGQVMPPVTIWSDNEVFKAKYNNCPWTKATRIISNRCTSKYSYYPCENTHMIGSEAAGLDKGLLLATFPGLKLSFFLKERFNYCNLKSPRNRDC